MPLRRPLAVALLLVVVGRASGSNQRLAGSGYAAEAARQAGGAGGARDVRSALERNLQRAAAEEEAVALFLAQVFGAEEVQPLFAPTGAHGCPSRVGCASTPVLERFVAESAANALLVETARERAVLRATEDPSAPLPPALTAKTLADELEGEIRGVLPRSQLLRGVFGVVKALTVEEAEDPALVPEAVKARVRVASAAAEPVGTSKVLGAKDLNALAALPKDGAALESDPLMRWGRDARLPRGGEKVAVTLFQRARAEAARRAAADASNGGHGSEANERWMQDRSAVSLPHPDDGADARLAIGIVLLVAVALVGGLLPIVAPELLDRRIQGAFGSLAAVQARFEVQV